MARKATLTSTNSSSQRRWSRHALFARCIFLPPQLFGQGLDFDRVLPQRVIAMPLGKVGAPHEGAMLGGAAVIMPEVEVLEIKRCLARLLAHQAFLSQSFDNLLVRFHLFVGGLHNGFGLLVELIDP